YLSCTNYKSVVISNNKLEQDYVSLMGDEVIVLPKGIPFYEPGYFSNDIINVIGNVGTEEGVYSIIYETKNSIHYAMRKVIIVDNNRIKSLYPTITLNGESYLYLVQGNDYQEPGYEAYDQIDGNITNKVKIENNIYSNYPNEYTVKYVVTNSNGYTNYITRKVYVISNKSDLVVNYDISPSNMTNGLVTIKLNINGDYNKIIFPDGVEGKILEYQASENGKYVFTIIDKYGRELNKEVEVKNIDRTKPTGTCEATMFNGKTRVNVHITSSNEISGYNYIIGNTESGYITSNPYSVANKNNNSVKVQIKDYIGNETTISCKSKKITIQPTATPWKSSLDDNGIQTIMGGGSKLHIPITDALARRGYKPEDLNQCIINKVKAAGPGTRYGVAAAAFGLIDCTYRMTGGYVISYNHVSGKVGGDYCNYNSDICGRLGINRRWGTAGGQCSADECWHGLNCATFVRWAMCNGGMDLCTKGSAGAYSMTSKQYFPEADGVDIVGNRVIYYSGTNLTSYSASYLVRQIKPGDAIAEDTGVGHAFVVVGRDATGIYTAENGSYMRHLAYSTMLNGKVRYRILFLDKYYANTKNRNNLYN
ncbi:MAG: DUF5011 domain-containing protein, partial [Bacilli bacterium]|nr:DUF5011 domain-containing protein [Bacilli bacterium]